MSAPHAGTFTAASGVHIHRGDALPSGDRDSIFICESAQNLVQRQVRTPNGVTFTSRPAHSGRDFLSSRDTWFRPVFAANGPDGALYIVDMYENHRPPAVRAGAEPRAARFRGGEGTRPDLSARGPRLESDGYPVAVRSDSRQNDELTPTLEHPDAWWRQPPRTVASWSAAIRAESASARTSRGGVRC